MTARHKRITSFAVAVGLVFLIGWLVSRERIAGVVPRLITPGWGSSPMLVYRACAVDGDILLATLNRDEIRELRGKLEDPALPADVRPSGTVYRWHRATGNHDVAAPGDWEKERTPIRTCGWYMNSDEAQRQLQSIKTAVHGAPLMGRLVTFATAMPRSASEPPTRVAVISAAGQSSGRPGAAMGGGGRTFYGPFSLELFSVPEYKRIGPAVGLAIPALDPSPNLWATWLDEHTILITESSGPGTDAVYVIDERQWPGSR